VTFGTEGVEDLLHTYTAAFLKVFDADLSQAQMTRSESGDMTVSVASEALEDLLQRSDKLSSSFEHVFKRLVQKKYGDLAERLVLDAGEATAKRVEGLQELARNLANKVIETGKSVTLNSRSGQERRVIHLTIDEIEGVATRSIGSGDGRKLVIYSMAQDEARRQQRNEAKSQADTPDETGASRRSRSGNRGRRGRGSGRGQGAGRTQGRAEGSY
jgi:predicted RNA-binding protein Jag